jgi:group I intron endonuclease
VLKREQFYLDSLNPEYNILKKAGSRLGSEQSEETKARIRMALTGYKHSEITKSKMKAARLGTSTSDETKAKLKEAMALKLNDFFKLQGLKITVLDLDTKITTEYDSIRRAAEGIGCDKSSLLRYEKLQLNKGYTKPFKDRYVIVINRNEKE